MHLRRDGIRRVTGEPVTSGSREAYREVAGTPIRGAQGCAQGRTGDRRIRLQSLTFCLRAPVFAIARVHARQAWRGLCGSSNTARHSPQIIRRYVSRISAGRCRCSVAPVSCSWLGCLPVVALPVAVARVSLYVIRDRLRVVDLCQWAECGGRRWDGEGRCRRGLRRPVCDHDWVYWA